ncbi:MAG TPA: protein kinase [Gemmataceae bacterium]|jgi:serine/threonine protein kinase/Leucine-rich repeat (LRR) protein|nr:protein kinase [Gemmataceae bacterium]
MEPTVQSLCQLLVTTRLLPAGEVHNLGQRWLKEAGSATPDVEKFARWLVANQLVTEYQAGRLLQGKTDHYFFNQYKLLDRIGAGRMAGVFKAMHRLGQVVAIKVLPPSKAKDPQAFGRFQREARLALRLKHPNVVRTFQTGVADNLHYLVMEYLDGETLEEVLKRRGKLPPAEAARLIHQALQGLQQLHEQGMVHRDLKPANLMLTPAPAAGERDTTLGATLKILDIGVGRALFDEGDAAAGGQGIELTNQGDILGSPDYMAPEQARDAHSADTRSDIYTLGCVLYHALTGQPPFPEGNLVQKLKKHVTSTPRPLKDFDTAAPARLQAILDQMLAKDPARRYATPAQAARALQSFLARGQERAEMTASAKVAISKLQDYERWLETSDPEAAPVSRKKNTPAGAGSLHRAPSKWLVAGGAGLAAVVLIIWLLFGNRGSKQAPDDGSSGQETMAAWVTQVAALPAEKQADEVAAKLKKLNPDFNGWVQPPKIEDGVVTELQLVTDSVKDISPIQALKGLKRLTCTGSAPGKGQLADLEPLRGLNLTALVCGPNPVSDLAPLKGMPLIFLSIPGTPVRDLSPLSDMPLLVVNCSATLVRDLSPLGGLEKLTFLDIADVPVEDLSPLRDLPLQTLWADVRPERDAELVGSLKELDDLNGKPKAAFEKDVAALQARFNRHVTKLPVDRQFQEVVAELKKRNRGFDGKVTPRKDAAGAVVELSFVSDAVTDLSPLRALPKLTRLICNGSRPGKGKLASLQPLKGLPLTELDCGESQVVDLAPLRKMNLTRLRLQNTPVHDLAPLGRLRLRQLNIAQTPVRDLTPLKGMKLTSLALERTRVIDLAPLQGMPLKHVSCYFQPLRDTAILRSLRSLEKINLMRAADFWKDADARQLAFADYLKSVARLKAEDQIEAVAARLKELNPGFDGDVGGSVTALTFATDNVTDLSPVRALPGLKTLTCAGSAPGKGKLFDLSPLKGLPLTSLDIRNTQVALAQLKTLQVKELSCDVTSDDDLNLLRSLKLAKLNGKSTQQAVVTESRPKGPTRKFLATLVAVRTEARRSPGTPRRTGALTVLTVQITQAILVPNLGNAYSLEYHRRKYLKALGIRNPYERMRRIQEHLYYIAFYQANLYDRVAQHHKLDLLADDNTKIRVRTLPQAHDDKGKPRRYTKEELKELKGPGSLPGYRAEQSNLMPPIQAVEVYLPLLKAAQPVGKEKDQVGDSRPRVDMIVILQ